MSVSSIGYVGARATGANALSPLARQMLEHAQTLGVTHPDRLAEAIARLPEAAEQRQVLDELAPHLGPADLASVQTGLSRLGI